MAFAYIIQAQEKILSFAKMCSKECNDFPYVLSHAVNMGPFKFH